MLAEITLLKTACHFLLLLVGFDTLTYRKDYDRSPIVVGHQFSFLFTLPPRFLAGAAFLVASYLVLEAFLAERLVVCKVDCRADGLYMPNR